MKKYIKKHKGIAVLFMIAGVLNALIGVFSSYTMQYVTEIVANGKKDRIKVSDGDNFGSWAGIDLFILHVCKK